MELDGEVRSANGKWTQVVSFEREQRNETVYNFAVEDNHNYFVGEQGTLVHNVCDLTDFRRAHILNRHKYGAGKSGKTEFPARWSDDDIINHVSDVATDPKPSMFGVGKYNSPYVIGLRDGVHVRVDFYPPTHPLYAGKISTAYPIGVVPNP